MPIHMLCEERANVILPNSGALIRKQHIARGIAPRIVAGKNGG